MKLFKLLLILSPDASTTQKYDIYLFSWKGANVKEGATVNSLTLIH